MRLHAQLIDLTLVCRRLALCAGFSRHLAGTARAKLSSPRQERHLAVRQLVQQIQRTFPTTGSIRAFRTVMEPPHVRLSCCTADKNFVAQDRGHVDLST